MRDLLCLSWSLVAIHATAVQRSKNLLTRRLDNVACIRTSLGCDVLSQKLELASVVVVKTRGGIAKV